MTADLLEKLEKDTDNKSKFDKQVKEDLLRSVTATAYIGKHNEILFLQTIRLNSTLLRCCRYGMLHEYLNLSKYSFLLSDDRCFANIFRRHVLVSRYSTEGTNGTRLCCRAR